jgi:Zn-dependent membrane protease YugP
VNAGGFAIDDHGYQQRRRIHPPADWSESMLVVGLILLLIGIFAHISILTTIGIILLIVGAVFWILGSVGRPVAGRRYWY